MYKRKTPHYQIPVVAQGQRIQSDEEMRRATIVENQLIASTGGVKCAVFQDGHYRLREEEDGTYSVVLGSTGANMALMGTVYSGLAMTNRDVVWKGLVPGDIYRLYVRWTRKLFENPKSFRVLISKRDEPIANEQVLYLARVDMTDADPAKFTIDRNPPGKVYSQDIARHSTDTEDPHGETLIQTNLEVREVLSARRIVSPFELVLADQHCEVKLSDDKNAELATENKTLVGGVNELKKGIEEFAQASTSKVKLLRVESAGRDGIMIEIPDASEIVHIEVHQLVQGRFVRGLGDIGVGYFGVDDTVDAASKCKIYNDGKTGIVLRVTAYYRS
jgi:hypothetical protein